jgi:hypothetical protein
MVLLRRIVRSGSTLASATLATLAEYRSFSCHQDQSRGYAVDVGISKCALVIALGKARKGSDSKVDLSTICTSDRYHPLASSGGKAPNRNCRSADNNRPVLRTICILDRWIAGFRHLFPLASLEQSKRVRGTARSRPTRVASQLVDPEEFQAVRGGCNNRGPHRLGAVPPTRKPSRQPRGQPTRPATRLPSLTNGGH